MDSQMVQVPWGEPHGRFTVLFERLSIDLLLEYSLSAASETLDFRWDVADGIKQRAVQHGLRPKQAQPLPRLGGGMAFGRIRDYEKVLVRVEPGREE